MGQRANYIIIDGNSRSIHYNHWRANHIAADLYLGEKRFLDFVADCQVNDMIINTPWIEGCVIIDKNKRHLYCWAYELNDDTLNNYYIAELAKKWKGWQLKILPNRMYDAEKILGVDYISKQEFTENNIWTAEKISEDKVDEWGTAIVVIRTEEDLLITQTGNLGYEPIISYGEAVLPLLLPKKRFELPLDDGGCLETIVIDTVKKQIYISQSEFGLWEQCSQLWPGYTLTMGDYGYLKTLQLGGIETNHLRMPQEEIAEQFTNMVKLSDNFDPHAMAEKLLKEEKDIQFNPDFFDNVKPKRSLLGRIKKFLSRS